MNGTEQLSIEVHQLEAEGSRIARVKLTGEVDLANAEELSQAFGSSDCAEADGILLDLKGLEFMDSSGLRVVLIAAQERDGQFATILSEGSAVATLFEMVDVAERLNVVASEDEAVTRIQTGADAAS